MRFPTLITDERARPIIPLIVQSASGERALVDALVDTGADITLLSETVAEALGLDLTGVPESPIRTPLGHAGTYRAGNRASAWPIMMSCPGSLTDAQSQS